MPTALLTIRGMHCQACIQRVRTALDAVPGVREVDIRLLPDSRGQAKIISDAADARPLIDAVVAAGYDAQLETETREPALEPAPDSQSSITRLYPLFLIVTFITGVAAIAAFVRTDAGWHSFMLEFMAGFFLVFSFFKLLDIKGFATAYQSYDLIAARSRAYAMTYPFIELALGIAYLLRWQLAAVNIITLVLMLVGSVGVLKAVLDKRRIRCACLGTSLNLPMTTVTVVEDLGMAAMAAAMLIWRG